MSKTVRLTLDVPEDSHKILKMFCAEMNVSMKIFVLGAAFEKLNKICEDLEKDFK